MLMRYSYVCKSKSGKMLTNTNVKSKYKALTQSCLNKVKCTINQIKIPNSYPYFQSIQVLKIFQIFQSTSQKFKFWVLPQTMYIPTAATCGYSHRNCTPGGVVPLQRCCLMAWLIWNSLSTGKFSLSSSDLSIIRYRYMTHCYYSHMIC